MHQGVYDYLIVGQGIAGSVMAMTLLQHGKSVYIMDSPKQNTSSRIAAGIMNPVTGKRMTLTWEAANFFPKAMSFYTEMETMSNATFLHKHPIFRIFSSVGEQNDWSAKQSNPKYHGFIESDALDNVSFQGIKAPFGSMKVSGGGRLDTNSFLDFVRNHFIKMEQFAEIEIKENEMHATDQYTLVLGIKAKKVIFCTGANPMSWKDLPFTLMKGEVLEVSSNELEKDNIFVGGCFLCPTKESQFYAGATYDWRNINLIKTKEAKTDILNRLSNFTTNAVTVEDHRVGIRPAVKDRRPLLGVHSTKPNTFLFSGLGSKGVSMAPGLANMLYNYIENGEALDASVDLKRFEA
ncbi:MAG: glycine oxidase [Bacteroidia bacterium]|jgi:glycine oxidase